MRRLTRRHQAGLLAGAGALACALVISLAALASGSTATAGSAGASTRTSTPGPARPAGPAPAVAAKPAGFWRGTDSTTMTVTGTAPYRVPAVGGAYGGYIGMIGNWSAWQHCGTKTVWSASDSRAARTDLVSYHQGIGVGVYWFMAGPGVDPHYNGTAAEATAWGRAQARQVIRDLASQSPKPNYPVVFMDVELPGSAPAFTPATDNGWNSVYTSACSGKVKSGYVRTAVDRADFTGFANYLTSHSGYKAGVYSAAKIWRSIFGTGTDAAIPTTYEWTYNTNTSSLAHHPAGWCLQGTATCAHFFGGVTSRTKYALAWQWSGGGGTWNGYGDFDQIDGNRTP
jgi:hypothetical protein